MPLLVASAFIESGQTERLFFCLMSNVKCKFFFDTKKSPALQSAGEGITNRIIKTKLNEKRNTKKDFEI